MIQGHFSLLSSTSRWGGDVGGVAEAAAGPAACDLYKKQFHTYSTSRRWSIRADWHVARLGHTWRLKAQARLFYITFLRHFVLRIDRALKHVQKTNVFFFGVLFLSN
jgi:hypothetical protein